MQPTGHEINECFAPPPAHTTREDPFSTAAAFLYGAYRGRRRRGCVVSEKGGLGISTNSLWHINLLG